MYCFFVLYRRLGAPNLFLKSATSACVRLCTPNNSYTTSPPTQSYKQPDWTLPDQDLRSQVLPRQTTVLKMILHLLHISSQLQQNKYLADVKRYIGRKSLRKWGSRQWKGHYHSYMAVANVVTQLGWKWRVISQRRNVKSKRQEILIFMSAHLLSL